jgi:hypothetical protein
MGDSCICTESGTTQDGRPVVIVNPDCPVHGNPEDR